MASHNRHSHTILAGALALAVCTTAGLSCTSPGPGPQPGAVVFPSNPAAQHGGKTYSEWAVEWWRWVFAQPATNHPLFDTTGADALRGQDGDVIFLANSFSTAETVTRTITIPAGKPLFFPIYTWEADDFADPELTVEQRQAMLDDFAHEVTSLSLSIDGVAATNVMQLRATPPQPFTASLPEADDLFSHFGADDVPASISVVADGYWAYLEPLPAGQHTIVFGGVHPPAQFTATYHITVE